jgi:hypothetical protein
MITHDPTKHKEAIEALETLVDKTSVSFVLEALAQICAEKGEHINANWQDGVLARIWQRAGVRIQTLSDKMRI